MLEAPQLVPLSLHLYSAVATDAPFAEGNNDSVTVRLNLAKVDVELCPNVSHIPEVVPKPGVPFVATPGEGVELRLEGKMGRHEFHCFDGVALVECLIEAPYLLHVLLRHRLLRQADGFEGLYVVIEVLPAEDLA